jgi:hypothetical protein
MIEVLKPLIRQFMPFAQEKMGFSHPPRLFLRKDEQNAANPMGKTGFYDPQNESITLYITGRHPKDIMRSLAHELMHHTQKCNGEFENVQNMGEEGYAQSNPHMRTMEIEAYQASIVFRDWEDSTKGTIYYEQLQKGDNSSMSTKDWKNGELKSLLSEAWGFKMDLSKLNESKEESTEEEEPLEEMGCPSDDDGHEMVVQMDGPDDSGEIAVTDVDDAEGMANELLSLAQRIADMLGQDSSVSSLPDEEEPDLEERRGRGRDNHTIRGQEGQYNLRPEGKELSETQLRAFIRTALKEAAKTKGK